MSLTLVDCVHAKWPLQLAAIPPGAKVSKVIAEAGEAFALETGLQPEIAFIRDIPTGAEEFAEVRGILLVRADWVPAWHVAVGRGGMQIIEKEYQRWKKI